MHPALPGGVHLKALDVYESIFKIIETKRLQTDLYVYRYAALFCCLFVSLRLVQKLCLYFNIVNVF